MSDISHLLDRFTVIAVIYCNRSINILWHQMEITTSPFMRIQFHNLRAWLELFFMLTYFMVFHGKPKNKWIIYSIMLFLAFHNSITANMGNLGQHNSLHKTPIQFYRLSTQEETRPTRYGWWHSTCLLLFYHLNSYISTKLYLKILTCSTPLVNNVTTLDGKYN